MQVQATRPMHSKKANKQETKNYSLKTMKGIYGCPVTFHLSEKLKNKGKCHYYPSTVPLPSLHSPLYKWDGIENG